MKTCENHGAPECPSCTPKGRLLALADEAERMAPGYGTVSINMRVHDIISPDRIQAPNYATSLDAVRCVSNWVLLQASDIAADGLPTVRLGNTDPCDEVVGIGATLELAYLAAALRAKAAEL